MFRKKAKVEKQLETDSGVSCTATTVSAHSIEFATRHFEPARRASTGETIVESRTSEVAVFSSNSSESLRRLQQNAAAGQPPDDAAKKPVETKEDREPPEPRQSTWYSWAWSRKPAEAPEPAGEVEDEASAQALPGKDKEGGSWAFWSKKRHNGDRDEGELAISGTDTAEHPRQATFVEHKSTAPAKKDRSSLVIPTYMTTLQWQTPRSRLFSSLARWGLASPQKVCRTAPPAVRRVVVVGVHGYFPARMTRAILGEPTGTSIKFANEAAAELEKWAAEHSLVLDIEKIALEGEGKIDHRVLSLYRLLLNWQDHIQGADLVFFAAHSQGTVVTTHLIARLFDDGLLTSRQRVGFLGMAGTCLGPNPGMDQTLVGRAITRIENDSLQELFELQKPQSPLSQAFLQSFKALLRRGVKTTLVGATDDQLVPLYSALCVNINHPNLLRGAYLDGDDVAPEVIAPLIELALTALNNGQSDAGVVVELSGTLAGALTGKGHSKLYSHPLVYRLGIEAALETSVAAGIEASVDDSFAIPRSNPYVLPWALHDLISQVGGQPEYQPTVEQLKREFETWKPEAKTLKDLKYRMGALKRAKL